MAVHDPVLKGYGPKSAHFVANLGLGVAKAGGSPSGFLTDNAAIAYVLVGA